VAGNWQVLLDSDQKRFGGSGLVNGSTITAENQPFGVFAARLSVTLPPLGIVLLRAPRPGGS
jgi:1,4-alpha-glucan branching enzyme